MDLQSIQTMSQQAVSIQELTGRVFTVGIDGIEDLSFNDQSGLIEILRRGKIVLSSVHGWIMTPRDKAKK